YPAAVAVWRLVAAEDALQDGQRPGIVGAAAILPPIAHGDFIQGQAAAGQYVEDPIRGAGTGARAAGLANGARLDHGVAVAVASDGNEAATDHIQVSGGRGFLACAWDSQGEGVAIGSGRIEYDL